MPPNQNSQTVTSKTPPEESKQDDSKEKGHGG